MCVFILTSFEIGDKKEKKEIIIHKLAHLNIYFFKLKFFCCCWCSHADYNSHDEEGNRIKLLIIIKKLRGRAKLIKNK